MTEHRHTHTHTRTLGVLIAVLLVASAPVAALPLVGGSTAPTPEIVRYGTDAQPTFIVETNDAAGLDDWLNASTDRRLVDSYGNHSVIAAPRWDVQAAGLADVLTADAGPMDLLDTTLADRSYVESVHLNYRLSLAEPVSEPLNASAFDVPTIGPLAFNDPALPTAGMAFSGDANRTIMSESRAIVDADGVSATGEGTMVAVLDTGINTAGGALFGNGTANATVSRLSDASKNILTNETVASDGLDAISDGNGHGTWVASAAAANAYNDSWDGIAPNATVLGVKVLADDGSGSTADIAAGIRYAADQGADVISMSLGSPQYSDAIADAVQYARKKDALVVVAAGNARMQYRPVSIATPADVPGVLAVGATNGSAPSTAGAAYFSQVSGDTPADGNATNDETVDIAAPGMQMVALTASTSGVTSETALSGTSMAQPLVAGVATLARAEEPAWNESTTAKWLIQGAEPVPNAATAEVGHGMVNAGNTLNQIKPDRSQTDAMDSAAQQRQTFLEAFAKAAGGFLTNLLA